LILFPVERAYRSMKYLANNGMSSFLSRSDGTRMGNTFNR
jgi:hypothetical protein